jgi:hypothetical protein
VIDLLTVRYFQLIGRDTPMLYARNAKGTDGKEHSGLTAAELKNAATLLGAYHEALRNATDSVLEHPLRDRSGA